MTKSVSNDTKTFLLTKKLEMWQNTLYDAQLDAEIAMMFISNETITESNRAQAETLSETSRDRMKSALKAIELLNGKLSELTKEE